VVALNTSINLIVAAAPAKVTVPNLAGLTFTAATDALKAAGLLVGAVSRQASNLSPDTVLQQSPAAGQLVPQGSVVNLVLAAGPTTAAVPNVIGLILSAATDAIARAGFRVGIVTRQQSAATADTVLQQDPAAGLQAPLSSPINLIIAAAGATVVVPDVIGMKLAKATKAINAAGLVVGLVQKQQSNGPPGAVFQQQPIAGTQVAPGTAIDLVVDDR